MNKILIALLLTLYVLFCTAGCSPDEEPMDLDDLLKMKEISSEENTTEETETSADTGEFVSVWPDELPLNPDSSSIRPIQYMIEINPGEWTTVWDYTSMYLYDFPDPEPVFHQWGHSLLNEANMKAIYFKYSKLEKMEDESEDTEDVSLTNDDFKWFIDTIIAAGYTENSERTETSYYCEKYGVGITVILSDVFPFTEDDSRFRAYNPQRDCCYVRLQLIDQDYEMDLEAIKAEEYRKWLESH